jgi:hypothetical protein
VPAHSRRGGHLCGSTGGTLRAVAGRWEPVRLTRTTIRVAVARNTVRAAYDRVMAPGGGQAGGLLAAVDLRIAHPENRTLLEVAQR